MSIKYSSCIALMLNLVILQLLVPKTAAASEPRSLSAAPCSEVYGSAGAINEAGYIDINGIKLWLSIKGQSCANPVVLFVHGGPGNPMSIFSAALYQEWEKDFTIVQWDQRAAGKTYEANLESGEITSEMLDATPLTLNLIVQDGLAVADFVTKKLTKNKLIISGTSWGSVVAVHMITDKPEFFQFYVGLSQLVNYHANLLDSYQKVLLKLQQNTDEQSADILQSMGPPPWNNPRNFGKLRKMSRKLEAGLSDEPVELQVAKLYQTEHYDAAYNSGEEFSFIKFVGLNADGMAQAIELDKTHLDFKIPVYLIQGEEDLLTSADITKQYFAKLNAPYKNYISVTRSGHDPNKKMFAQQLQVLQEALKK